LDKRLGFIHDKFDIKILILFVLNRLSDYVAHDTLLDIIVECDEGISYFDVSECVANLCETDHVSEKDNKYLVTEKGRENGSIMESSLPYSVRVKAERSTSALANMQKRSSMITATHNTRSQGGYKVNLSMSDGIGPVMNIELFVADEKMTAVIERKFTENAEIIYNRLLDSLLEK